MADERYYLGPGDWNTDANWSLTPGGAGGASFPTGANPAVFDDNSGDCTLDANAAALSITIGTAADELYTGTLDAATFDVALGSGGLDDTYAGSATVLMGSGTWTITGGTFSHRYISVLTAESSTVVMKGTGTLIGASAKHLNNLTIFDSAVTTVSPATSNYVTVDGTLEIDGGLVLNDAVSALWVAGSNVVIRSGANVSGASLLQVSGGIGAGSGITIFEAGAVITAPILLRDFRPGAVFAAGEYAAVKVTGSSAARILSMSGNYIFNGTFETETAAGDLTISNAANPNIIFNDDVVTSELSSGSIIWTKGTGTITIAGTAAQSIDFGDQSIEQLIIANTNTATFTGGWTATRFDAQTGTFDPNGQTLETVGAFTIGSSADVVAGTDAWNGTALTVGGSFSASGSVGDLLNLRGTATWTLTVAGTAVADYVDVSHSDADAGTWVNTTNSMNSGTNPGWYFLPQIARHYHQQCAGAC